MASSSSGHVTVFGSVLFALVLILCSVIVGLSLSASNARAQTYSFSVQVEYVDVYIKMDGSVSIYYALNMTNYGYLDGIDIGLPNKYYDASSASATIVVDGVSHQPAQVRESPYVEIGMAVEFDTTTFNLINEYGKQFTVLFQVNNPHMVYENELVEGTAGIKFRPTWFDPTFQQGPTEQLRARIFFPDGFTNISEAVYLENSPWDSIALDGENGLVVATWSQSNVYPSSIEQGSYDVGAGFPKQYVDTYFKESSWDAVGEWFSALGDVCCALAPILGLAGVVAFIYIIGKRAEKKQLADYFEPELSLAGAGPRRDLTAVEAAVVLERPLEMVATMILFGLIKKGKVRVRSESAPMVLEKLAITGDYEYESKFLASINSAGIVDRSLLRGALVELIHATETKLKGFDYTATMRYYNEICDAAWEQVKAAGTPEDFAKGLDQNNEWMMLDKGYVNRMNTIFLPIPTGSPGGRVATTASGTAAGRATPGIRDMAQGYVNRVSNASKNLVSASKNLSKEVANIVHPAPVKSASSGWSRGGGFGGGFGGGGCACACACACAGGGR